MEHSDNWEKACVSPPVFCRDDSKCIREYNKLCKKFYKELLDDIDYMDNDSV